VTAIHAPHRCPRCGTVRTGACPCPVAAPLARPVAAVTGVAVTAVLLTTRVPAGRAVVAGLTVAVVVGALVALAEKEINR
jgi:hypothetical protein